MIKKRARLNSILDMTSADFIQEVSTVEVPGLGEVQVKVVKGDFEAVPLACQQFIARYVSIVLLQSQLQICFVKPKVHQNPFSAGSSPWTPLWEL